LCQTLSNLIDRAASNAGGQRRFQGIKPLSLAPAEAAAERRSR
jgi:hypothetical protein